VPKRRVLREFRRADKNGNFTSYKPGDPFSGVPGKYDLDPSGPDGRGPLLADEVDPTPTDSSSKEKS
jgi:hypothetical protein